MEFRKLSDDLYVSQQIQPSDIAGAKAQGIKSIIVNRPDGEGADQPTFAEIESAAKEAGLEARYIPVQTGKVTDDEVGAFGKAMKELPGPVLGYCRSGTRTTTLWTLSQIGELPAQDVVSRAKGAGYDMSGVAARAAGKEAAKTGDRAATHQIVIVGGGAGGIAAAASMLARTSGLDIAIIEPAEEHYYQPGWTLVGAGIFTPEETRREMAPLIPEGVTRITAAVAAFEPDAKAVILEDCRAIGYEKLVVAPGLKLNWSGIEGLEETLGRNGVTSNYRYDLAAYTWELVQGFRGGPALFTQPSMPIKCAGAPQKTMYLSCDAWRRRGVLENAQVEFLNAGPSLFGVSDYVPALMEYVERYGIDLSFKHNLTKVDGPNRKAWFTRADDDGNIETVERKFEMIHVVPPQTAPDFVRASPLANEAGWVEVDQETLRHVRYPDIYSLGDVMSAPNAKTAAAARKQAPVVAENLLRDLGKLSGDYVVYNGYGSCPLTVERGKVVLAEFGYGGKRIPSFPKWFIDDLKPSRAAWMLKERVLPPVYWRAMLKGREPMAKPEHSKETA